MTDQQPPTSAGIKPGQMIIGGHLPDPPLPEDHPSVGYNMNHVMLRIRDPARSLPFYIDLMGMRTISTANGGPFTNYYLGYPRTPEHRADLKTFSAETAKRLPFTPGLLELKHVHGGEKAKDGHYSNGNKAPNLGFGHLGFTVPDVKEALERLEAAGVKVFKPLEEANRASIPLSDWEAEQGIGVGEPHENYKGILRKIGFVYDPVS
jgi:lactoylglutathione lyase